MDSLHSLLKRQMKKYLTITSEQFFEDNQKFVRAIDEAYNRFDADRLMIERSLELTSKELIEKNKSLLNYIEKLNYIAYHDTLTHLYNRAFLTDKLDMGIAKQKNNPSKVFAVLFLDLDRFKLINDAMGHSVGDKLLGKIATRLTEFSSKTVTIVRLGSDEFVVLVENIESEQEVLLLAENINKSLKHSFHVDYHEVFITVSIGIAFSSLGYENSSDILRDADTAMYNAKQKGRGRFQVFDKSMHNYAATLVELESNLRQAIQNNEFILYYQPIINALSDQVSGFEALIRWNHPVKGFIPPADFIPIAEETGMINVIGEWVIRTAAEMTKRLQAICPKVYVSVNLSFVQF
jgi:diguanylate cyclase (GGDEF)-like protein